MHKYLLALGLIFTGAACSGGVDGNPDNDQHDQDQVGGDGDHDAVDDQDDDTVGDSDNDQTDNDLPGDSDTCTYAEAGDEACPAPAVCADQSVVFDEKRENSWTTFADAESIQTTTVCSGTKAYQCSVAQFDIMAFNHGPSSVDLSDVAANHLSMRVWVSADSSWTVAGIPKGKDGHCYRLPLPTTCSEGFEGTCHWGGTQHTADCIQHWTSGWNIVELDIPPVVGAVAQIMFELQSSGTVTLVLDDVRLTTP